MTVALMAAAFLVFVIVIRVMVAKAVELFSSVPSHFVLMSQWVNVVAMENVLTGNVSAILVSRVITVPLQFLVQ